MSLIPHALKIFLEIIQARIKNKIDKGIGSTQFGCRPGPGTRETIYCFNIMAQKCIEIDQDIYTCFIKYSKAFDKAHHFQLRECLEKIRVDCRDMRVIANLYRHQKATIRIKNELSPFTELNEVSDKDVFFPPTSSIFIQNLFLDNEITCLVLTYMALM